MSKKVSIIMGIFNCEDTLKNCIDSIIKQTYTNWELIMCDDGSIDKTYSMALEYTKMDKRIKLIKNEKNEGLPKTLNKCLLHCNGEYIMRHDADDIMVIDRIEKQIKYMENYDCDACGGGAYLFDDNGIWGIRQLEHKPGKEVMIISSPFIHPTVMMKREILISVSGYTENEMTKQRLEDYDLWLKFYEKGFILHNIQEPLIYFREDLYSYRRKLRKYRFTETKMRLIACKRLCIPYFQRLLAFKPLILLFIPQGVLRKYHIKKARQQKQKMNLQSL